MRCKVPVELRAQQLLWGTANADSDHESYLPAYTSPRARNAILVVPSRHGVRRIHADPLRRAAQATD